MKVKISNSGQFSKIFPSSVQQVIKNVATDHRISTLDFETVPPSEKFYVGEGESYHGIAPDGRSAGFETVSENNVGASGLSHRIGERFQMPAGSYLVNVYYYGKYFMSVYHITEVIEA